MGMRAFDFEDVAKQWVYKLYRDGFCNISVLSQEEVLYERSKREEVMALLADPKQAAGELDAPDDEGITVLMYACMHGWRGVVESNGSTSSTRMDFATSVLSPTR